MVRDELTTRGDQSCCSTLQAKQVGCVQASRWRYNWLAAVECGMCRGHKLQRGDHHSVVYIILKLQMYNVYVL
jgi:hypothetical protein